MKCWWLTVMVLIAFGLQNGCSLSAKIPSESRSIQVNTRHDVTDPAQAAPGTDGVERIPSEWLPSLEEVATVHLAPGLSLPAGEAPQPLYATHPWHRSTIAYLLDELAKARLSQGEISPPARTPSLTIGLKNGACVSVRAAYDCTGFTSETGHGYTCRQAPGQLILHTRQGRDVRVTHAFMASWLMNGWRADLPVGPVTDLDKETVLEIARRIDSKAMWQARLSPEYPVEAKAGTEVHRAWVLESESPGGSKIRLVVDAQTGEILRVGQLEALQ